MSEKSVDLGGTFVLGGDLPVHRLGFGAMRITGPGVWGEPRDRAVAIAVLKRVVELGITLIDTADSYGPEVSERLIATALHPYPPSLVIATKAGFDRPGPGQWKENGRPAHLRTACEGSLRRLKLERIDLFQLHRIDPAVAMEDQVGTLIRLQEEGKIRHLGLSEVGVEEIERVRKLVPIVSVQNRYNPVDRTHDPVIDYCERHGIGFLPWFPLGSGALARAGESARPGRRRAARDARAGSARLAAAPLPGDAPHSRDRERGAPRGKCRSDTARARGAGLRSNRSRVRRLNGVSR